MEEVLLSEFIGEKEKNFIVEDKHKLMYNGDWFVS